MRQPGKSYVIRRLNATPFINEACRAMATGRSTPTKNPELAASDCATVGAGQSTAWFRIEDLLRARAKAEHTWRSQLETLWPHLSAAEVGLLVQTELPKL